MRQVPDRSTPLVWRLRHRLGAVAFYLAILIALLGGWTVLRGIVEGDFPSIGVGLTLIVGGMLIMVGRRMGRQNRGKRR